VVFSCFVHDHTPPDILDELRWHLGLTTQTPATPYRSAAYPLLAPDPASYLSGGDVASLRRQFRRFRAGREVHAWGLFSRNYCSTTPSAR
jgi:hypothetical protein